MELIIVVKFVLAFVVGGLFSFISMKAESPFGIILSVIFALVWLFITGVEVGMQACFWMFDMDELREINMVLSGFSRQACIFYTLWSGQAITFWICCWFTRNK